MPLFSQLGSRQMISLPFVTFFGRIGTGVWGRHYGGAWLFRELGRTLARFVARLLSSRVAQWSSNAFASRFLAKWQVIRRQRLDGAKLVSINARFYFARRSAVQDYQQLE